LLEELDALWQADTVFEPQLPVELADATYAVWGRAVEKSKGWAATELT
jgi:glycerol kinase